MAPRHSCVNKSHTWRVQRFKSPRKLNLNKGKAAKCQTTEEKKNKGVFSDAVHLEMHHGKAILSLSSRANAINQIHWRRISIHLLWFPSLWMSSCHSHKQSCPIMLSSMHLHPRFLFVLYFLSCHYRQANHSTAPLSKWAWGRPKYAGNCSENWKSFYLRWHWDGDTEWSGRVARI